MDVLFRIRNFPAWMILAVYLPAAIIGVLAFRDSYSVVFLAILLAFSGLYFMGFQFFVFLVGRVKFFLGGAKRLSFFDLRAFLVVSVFLYFLVTLCAALTADAIPLFIAFSGGTEMEISAARAGFLSSREGVGSILRYASFVASRSIVPMAVLYLFVCRHSFRYLFLLVVILCYSLTLEKVVPVFAMLPLVLFFLLCRRYMHFLFTVLFMVFLVVLLSWVSYGGLAASHGANDGGNEVVGSSLKYPDGAIIKGPVGNAERLYLKCVLPSVFMDKNNFDNFDCFESSCAFYIALLDRVLWVPYITAYDWLVFQDVGLGGGLTMGRSVSFVHLLFGEPKMQLEKIIYAYQRGPSPEASGTANTLFLIDAKLAFGWVGVLVYSFLFIFCAASVFSSSSIVLKVASINPFLVAVVSPLTATLLSGGLAVFVMLSLLLPSDDVRLSRQVAVSGI
ncbi:hypothetical protein [Aquipseudomonas alcaligenes]|uniref:hypothetical protein n=1 Tax=Aquipseudomonas alcaligenes TaxID=43263 RepID=UPI0035AE9F7B